MGNGDYEVSPRAQAVSISLPGKNISKDYLANIITSRLRRAFILIDSEHGIKQNDADILSLFRRYAIPHQIILSKVDKVLSKKKKKVDTGASTVMVQRLQDMLQEMRAVVQPDPRVSEGPGALGEILTCGAETTIAPGRALGIDAVRWAILSAAGIDGSLEGGQLAPKPPAPTDAPATMT